MTKAKLLSALFFLGLLFALPVEARVQLTLTPPNVTMGTGDTVYINWQATGASSYSLAGAGNWQIWMRFFSNTSNSGRIRLRPKDATGTFHAGFKVCARNNTSDCDTKNFTVTVATPAPRLWIDMRTFMTVDSGQAFSTPLSINGGRPPYTGTVSGRFPNGYAPVVDVNGGYIRCDNNSYCKIPVVASRLDYMPFTVEIRDSAGSTARTEFEIAVEPTVAPPDTTPPTITLTSHANGSTISTSSKTLRVEMTATDNDRLANVTWQNSLGGKGSVSRDGVSRYHDVYLYEGRNVLTFTAHDFAGNKRSVSLTIIKADNSAPTISITHPTSGLSYSTFDDSLNLKGTASDNLGVSSVNCANDRGGSHRASGTTAWSCNVTLQEGRNNITATVYDASGNHSSDTLKVTKKIPVNHHPQIEMISAPSTARAGQSFTITLRAVDSDNNLRHIKVDWRASGNYVTTKNVSPGQTVSFTYTYPRQGTFTWVATAHDSRSAGSYPVTRSIIVTANPLTSRNTGYHGSKTLRHSKERRCQRNCLVADPIDTATGAQVLTHHLLSVEGVLPISATLSYNSLLLTQGVVGRSWSLNGFDTRLQALPSGDIEVHWSTNRSNVFKNHGNGQFSGTDLVTLYDKLVKNNDDSFTLTRQNKTVYQFDETGLLVSLRNQKGQSLTFKRDTMGRLIQVTEPVSGVFIKYAYNNNNLLATITDSLNRQVHLGYDSDKNLVTITDAAGQTLTYTYNEFGQTLTGINGDGVQLFRNTYDTEGRIISQDDSVEGNQLFRLSYDDTTQPGKIISTVTNRTGGTRVYTYDDNYQLLSLRDELGNTTSYAYSNGRRSSETDANGHTTRFVYRNGHLVAMTNTANLSTAFSYDSRANLLSIKNALGQLVRWEYDANNNVIRQTDRAGQITRFAYNINGQLVKVMAPNGATTTYTYQQGRVAVITDANGKTQSVAYDRAGRVIQVTDANQQTTRFIYDPLNRLRSITDPLNRTVEMTYDSRDNWLTFKDAKGNLTRRFYDGNGNLIAEIDPLDRKTRYEYEGEGRLSKLIDSEGQITQWHYDAAGQVVKLISPAGNETQWVYDAVGNVVKSIDALGHTVQTSYDSLNNPLTIVDAAAYTTTLSYDALNRVTAIKNALGHTQQISYDVRGNVSTVRDAMGYLTRYGYDAHNNLIRETNALNQTTRYQYDQLHRLVKIIDAKGRVTRLNYDAKGRLVRVKNPLRYTTGMSYNAVDNLVKTTAPLGGTVETRYDQLDNPIQVTDALGRTTDLKYDAVNRLNQIKNALNQITHLEYNDVDQLIGSVDALNGQSSQVFDSEGHRVSLTDPNNNQTRFEFDQKSRLVAEISSAGGKQHYGYNARDLLTEVTNARGQKRQMAYDAAGRIAQISDEEGTIAYTYDANNNLLTVTDDQGTIVRVYDALNRVIKYTDTRGHTLQYVFDDVGQLVTLIYPDNKAVHYEYDAADQLTKVTDWAGRETRYEWDANGQLVREIRPNGTQVIRRYDKAGQLLQQTDISPSEVIAQFEFRYNAVGNITNEQPALKPPLLDATMTYTAANRLATYNSKPVKYDADGNMTKGPLAGAMKAFQFDSRNRLSQVAGTFYQYNAENQRIAVKSNGKTTHYVINPHAALSQVLVKTAADGTQTYYVYGLGLIGEETDGAYRAYHYDLRGSTIALTDATGTVVERFAYSAFAQLVSHPDTLPDTQFLYNGRDGVMTAANGLYYMRARYYSPEIRRFVNQDVLLGNVADGQTLNRYAYVTGNPVSYVDPFGLKQRSIYSRIRSLKAKATSRRVSRSMSRTSRRVSRSMSRTLRRVSRSISRTSRSVSRSISRTIRRVRSSGLRLSRPYIKKAKPTVSKITKVAKLASKVNNVAKAAIEANRLRKQHEEYQTKHNLRPGGIKDTSMFAASLPIGLAHIGTDTATTFVYYAAWVSDNTINKLPYIGGVDWGMQKRMKRWNEACDKTLDVNYLFD
ncbi:MAG: hypothetical protein DRR08_15345 [Candidatus Parabeggiatoa sp. nov. 2]|nr:MAG: hypothetical protein B6247_07890 [Beggiatoa sp. 4572_84]RKZ58846.1 MAG: hypothetical protein DRR08_15345 [Gammaproteobacteria bacterium]